MFNINPQGVLASSRNYDLGTDYNIFVKLDKALNAYVSSIKILNLDIANPRANLFQASMSKFLVNGSQQYQILGGQGGYKQSEQFYPDSNGVVFESGDTSGFPVFVKRFDNGLQTWTFGGDANVSLPPIAISGQSISAGNSIIISSNRIVTAQQVKSGIKTSPRNTLTKPAQTLNPCFPNVEM